MLIKAPEIEVSPKEPFKNDCLKRKQYADTLTRIVLGIRQPFVLAVDSAFGTGKTTFIRMWRQSLEDQQVKTLYFNAWENDFTENALISLLGEFRGALQPQGDSKLMKASIEAAKVVGKHGLSIGMKLLTAGLVDSEKLAEAVGQLAEKVTEERVQKYNEDKETLESFRTELSKFVQKECGGNPLIVFVDELDRCRPLFAIEVLEHAKHLFNVDGIVFVLSIDKEQLSHSLRTVYGAGMNVNGYLRRFIELEYRLPEPNLRDFVFSLERSMELAEAKFAGKHESVEDVLVTVTVLSRVFNRSLRETEQLFGHLLLCMRLPGIGCSGLCLCAALLCLRDYDSTRYRSVVSGQNSAPKEILERLLDFPRDNYDEYCQAIDLYANFSTALLEKQAKEARIIHINATATDETLPDAHREFLRSVARLVNNRRFTASALKRILEAVDLTEAFTNSP